MEWIKQRDRAEVYLEGELDHCSAQSIRRELDRVLEDQSIRHLILDMGKMSFMDSSGIGVILGRYRILAARGGTVAVRNMNAHVERIFILSGMHQIIRIL
ncbi:MAG: anti-sigma factor antagonist [Clostridia bacterium]|nr:anti-sigma factor antagonist [Clostridia bacterium]